MNWRNIVRLSKPARFPKLKNETWLWALFLVVGLTGATLAHRSAEVPAPAKAEEIGSLETFIPRDHLLIPVEIANADKLDGLLGANGIVDLYQVAGAQGGHAILVGRRLRLLRAPLNPNAFAVLLRENEADQFLAHSGPYIASVRPLNEKAHEIEHGSRAPRIEYQEN